MWGAKRERTGKTEGVGERKGVSNNGIHTSYLSLSGGRRQETLPDILNSTCQWDTQVDMSYSKQYMQGLDYRCGNYSIQQTITESFIHSTNMYCTPTMCKVSVFLTLNWKAIFWTTRHTIWKKSTCNICNHNFTWKTVGKRLSQVPVLKERWVCCRGGKIRRRWTEIQMSRILGSLWYVP